MSVPLLQCRQKLCHCVMRYHPTNQVQVCTSGRALPLVRVSQWGGHSICLCESSRSACVSGAVNTLHLVFAQRSNRALLRHKITLARVNGFHSWTAACTCGVGICTLFPEAELSFPRKCLLLCLLSWQECMWLLIRNDPSIHPSIPEFWLWLPLSAVPSPAVSFSCCCEQRTQFWFELVWCVTQQHGSSMEERIICAPTANP